MKIKIIDKNYSELLEKQRRMQEKREKHKLPVRPNMFFRTLMRLVAAPDLKNAHFKFNKVGMEKLGKKEPALILMNHSAFIDMEIVARLMYPRPFNIVATTDGFIGKNWLMRQIGCIPTKKFVNDTTLIRDIKYTLDELKSSVVLFPEAGYSFDGTATLLPDSLGRCVKLLGAPLVMITTHGAFSRDPLYNNLQHRKVNVSATEEYLLSPEQIKEMSVAEINETISRAFSFDNFRWQQENQVKISESFRADSLNRILYKCPACNAEGHTVGSGISLTCNACGKKYYLDEYGYMCSEDGAIEFSHIPEWYNWEREEVRRELEKGDYALDIPVDIMATIDTKHLYRIGEGRLIHNNEGFTLTGCDGELLYHQRPLASYTLNSDFNWYEVGDMISIGNNDILYYCFPKVQGDIVAKTRLAVEELYKIVRDLKRANRAAGAAEK
ncbi:MAG: 1-acyl-sn-glycerol-3-phosphate acyltransferase [Clostridia bacterium]|nr:1-acyl-sn-glycerol-3-phosphate acyltransferase [Clostridia bacterium]